LTAAGERIGRRPIVHRLTRHLRSILIATTALALTAGAALAAHATPWAPPAAAADGLARAAEAAGKTVPANQEPAAAGTTTDQTSTDTTVTDTAPTTDHPQNHGWFVSQAAQLPTPNGFDNHGAYVSSIAKGDAGKPPSAGGASTTGSTKSAAGKAKAAANRAGHGNH